MQEGPVEHLCSDKENWEVPCDTKLNRISFYDINCVLERLVRGHDS